MRLASFKTDGRTSYGAVTDSGIIDLGRKLSQYPTLLDVFRAQALPQARAAATGRPDYQIKDVEMLPPILAPEKKHLRRHNQPRPQPGDKDAPGATEISHPFLPLPESVGRTHPPALPPEV